MRWVLLALLAAGSQGARHPSSPALQAARGGPRVFFRTKAAAGVPGLDEIAAKAKRAPWSQRLDGLKETPHGKALHWLLTGDESSAKGCLDELRRMQPDDGYGLYAQGPCFTLPVAYDWLWGWKGFSDADKKAIEAKIATTADRSVEFLKGKDDSVWHTSAPRSLMAIALAAAALDGPKAQEYLAFAREYLEKTYAPSQAALDGGGVAGMTYATTEGFAPLSYALWALKTARDADYHKKYDWLERRADYLAQQLLPDLTWQRWGDCVTGSRCCLRDEGRHVVDMIARATGSKTAKWLSRRIAQTWPNRQGYHDVVLPDFFVFGSDEDAPAPAAPPEQMFGEKTIGQCVFRTGWGPGDTVVFCKAGDYFDNHGHFDQGHFTIWRKGWLAVDSGVYDSTSSRHHKEYAIRSVAHNVMLFGDDATGGQRTMSSQDSQDLADHEAKKKSRKLETADLVAWKVDKDWAYVAADLTAAYDGGVVKLWTRELVWLKRGAVVVFDRARASTPGRWLLHTVSEPAAQGAAFRVDEKESSLAGAVLLPKKARVSKVGPGCIVDGRDIAPEKAGEFGVPGAWRIEVESNGMTLVVLAPLEKGQAAPAAKLVEEAAGVGVEVLGKRVMFRKDGPRAVTIQ